MAKMKETDSCWGCKHLTSQKYVAPPVLCKAYPAGIPFAILAGIVWHDHSLGDEAEDVVFERKEGD